ncbi:MAG: Xylose isomerase-like barrel [Paenibacillaceae bacterium]|jgi:sugar phosphate isomerase/epimerase|nr:Xylose isomerase-like barrel [Paenibacillaceae bacterium]
MKMGISMPPLVLLEQTARPAEVALLKSFGGVRSMLRELKDQGIASIEIRNLVRTADAHQGLRMCELIWEEGLDVTLHGTTAGDFHGPTIGAIYPPLQPILEAYSRRSGRLTITFHPISAAAGMINQLSAQTVELYSEWLRLLGQEHVPYTCGIELIRINRAKIDPGVTCEGVLAIVNKLNNPNVGITWDMGHYYSNVLMKHEVADARDRFIPELPPDEFVAKTVHTHIHGIIGRNHCPLNDPLSLPLERYIDALKNSQYQGVLNLELEFPRFPDDRSVAWYTIASIERLRQCL